MYSSSFRRSRISVFGAPEVRTTEYGRENSAYPSIGDFWAAVTFTRGAKAMREGALDSYNTLLIRMRFCERLTRACIIQYKGKVYQIDSLNADYTRNEMQLTCSEKQNSVQRLY